MNVADSEVVAAVMQMAGYEMTESIDSADAVLLNTCSIRDNAEQKIISRLAALNAPAPQTRITDHRSDRLRGRARQRRPYRQSRCRSRGRAGQLPRPARAVRIGGSRPKAINVELSRTETYRDIIPARLGKQPRERIHQHNARDATISAPTVSYPTRGRERSRQPHSILSELADLRAKASRKRCCWVRTSIPTSTRTQDSPHCCADHGGRRRTDMRIRFTTSHPKDMTDDIIAAIASLATEHSAPHTPSGAERQQRRAPSHEPPLHPRMVS